MKEFLITILIGLVIYSIIELPLLYFNLIDLHWSMILGFFVGILNSLMVSPYLIEKYKSK